MTPETHQTTLVTRHGSGLILAAIPPGGWYRCHRCGTWADTWVAVFVRPVAEMLAEYGDVLQATLRGGAGLPCCWECARGWVGFWLAETPDRVM